MRPKKGLYALRYRLKMEIKDHQRQYSRTSHGRPLFKDPSFRWSHPCEVVSLLTRILNETK